MAKAELVELFVTPELAKLLKEKKYAELVFRDKDSKFQMFVKAMLGKNEGNKNADDFGNQLLQKVLKQNSNAKKLNHAVHKLDNDLKNVKDDLAKLINTAPALLKDAKVLKAVGFLNAGLAVANIAVDVAGFVIISKQLSELDEHLSVIETKVDQLKDIEEEKLLEQCRALMNDTSDIAIRFEDNDPVSKEELRELLNDMEPFLKRLISSMYKRDFEIEHLLQMLYGLLPGYFFLADKYMGKYYLEKGKMPSDFEKVLNLYEELLSDKFITFVNDYYFLDKGFTSADSLVVSNSCKVLAAKHMIYFYDREELLKVLKTQENVEKYDAAINQYVQKTIKDELDMFAKENKLTGAEKTELKQMMLMA